MCIMIFCLAQQRPSLGRIWPSVGHWALTQQYVSDTDNQEYHFFDMRQLSAHLWREKL